jgi:hypothetical protein
MLNKSNQWVVLTTIAIAISAVIGCSKGGGGGGAPVVDCRQPQNLNNTTCLNARNGNLNLPPGARAPIGTNGYRGALPPGGVVTLVNPNIGFMSALCSSSSATSAGNGFYQRSSYDQSGWGGSAYYQPAALYFNPVCMNIGTVVMTFKSVSQQLQNGDLAYGIGLKFYFIPAGIPVPPGSSAEQVRLASGGNSSPEFDDNNVMLGPTGFKAMSPQGIGFAAAKNGDVLNITILGPQGPVGTGSMTFQGY